MLLKEVENDKVNSKNQGWVCPKCDAVVAPHLDTCPSCSQTKVGEQRIPRDKQILNG